MEGLDFGKILMTLDYYIRKIMALLDSLLGLLGGGAAPEDSSDVTE